MGGNLVKRSFNLNILLDYRKLNDYLALLMARFDWNNNSTNYHIIFVLQKYQTTSVNLFLVLAGGECVIKICCFSVKIKKGYLSADTYQMVYSFLFHISFFIAGFWQQKNTVVVMTHGPEYNFNPYK